MSHTLNKYPDGTSYVNKVGLACNPFKINNYEDLWHLGQYVDAFISQHGIEPNILIPNLIDAQADRRFHKGESAGLKLVLRYLKGLPVKHYHIFHPHNPEVVEAVLKNRVEIIDNSQFMHNILNNILTEKFGGKYDRFQKQSLFNNLILMSSDAGGFKPLSKLCDKINWQGEMYSASKARSWSEEDGTKFVQQIDREDFQGKDILIVDDICVYGGTFKGIAKLLRKKNVGKLYLAISHFTIQNHKSVNTVFDCFDQVFTTNSKYDSYFITNEKGEAVQPDNLTVIKKFKYEAF